MFAIRDTVRTEVDHQGPCADTPAPSRIAADMIERIKSGDFQVGDPLPPERELCEAYDASRPTVREALSLMQMRGFVSLGGGKRPRAAKPSLDRVLASAAEHICDILGDAETGAHLEQMRRFIETGAASGAAERASSIQLAKMRAALEANLRAIGTDDFAATDVAFHRAIVDVIGNPIILTLHDMFVSSLLAQRPEVQDRQKHDEMIYEEHRQIYEAILDNQIDQASALIDHHLLRSYKSRLTAPKTVASIRNEAAGRTD